jgi:hypothetical protein
MSYIATDEKVAEFGFSFSFDEDDKFNKVDTKKGPDRFRMGYHEICLEGYNYRSLWDLTESLEEHDYRLVDAEATGLTYYSPDGKTEVYLDELLDAPDEACRVMILRGELMQDELPGAEQEVRALFYGLTRQ